MEFGWFLGVLLGGILLAGGWFRELGVTFCPGLSSCLMVFSMVFFF